MREEEDIRENIVQVSPQMIVLSSSLCTTLTIHWDSRFFANLVYSVQETNHNKVERSALIFASKLLINLANCTSLNTTFAVSFIRNFSSFYLRVALSSFKDALGHAE